MFVSQQGRYAASFFQQGAQQPATTPTWIRAIGIMQAMFPATVGLAVIGICLELVMPPNYRPSDLMGGFTGNVHSAEIRAQQPVVVENTRLMADAQAAPTANWQMEMVSFQMQQQAIYESMQTKISMVNVADIACILSPLVGATLFERGSKEARIAAGIGADACQLAVVLRSQIVAEQAQLGRDNSALMQRSAPGRTAPVAAPPAVAAPVQIRQAQNQQAAPIRY